MKNIFSLFICFFFPVKLCYWLLNILGHNIHPKSKIGFSLIWKTKLELSEGAYIGHFNFIYLQNLKLAKGALIRNINVIVGLFEMELKKDARIGKANNISRSRSAKIVPGVSKLELGELTCITKKAILDLTSDIIIGDFSQLAGVGCQLWTHGYYHASKGADRIRIDGKIEIGNNVYIGSGVLINPGVRICDSVNVGGNSTVAKSLKDPGMYVSQPLRFLNKDIETIKKNLKPTQFPNLVDDVYEKSL